MNFKNIFVPLGIALTFCSQSSFATGLIPPGSPLKADEIPGMSLLLKTVEALPIYSSEKTSFANAVLPTEKRTYYRMPSESLDPLIRQELVQKYAALWHIPESQVTLFAVTDLDLQRTILFPEFYSLKSEAAQAAMLFHESVWLLGSQTYRNVVAAETALQAYLEQPADEDTNFHFYQELARVVFYQSARAAPVSERNNRHDLHILLPAALAFDRKYHQNIFNNPDQSCMPLKSVVGADYISLSLTSGDVESAFDNLKIFTLANGSKSLFLRALAYHLNITSGPMAAIKWSKNLPTLASKYGLVALIDGFDLCLPPVTTYNSFSLQIRFQSQEAGIFTSYLIPTTENERTGTTGLQAVLLM